MTATLLRTAIPLLLLAFCGVLHAAQNAAQATLRIVLPMIHPSAQEHAHYFPQLLRLALDKTAASDGPYVIEHYQHELTSPRQSAELKKDGVINVMWDGTNPQRERELLPVRISLLRELNDYRVFLIRADQQERFRAVRTLDDLRQLKAGVGVNWPSADVLRRNGLPVVTSITYESLFPMLAVKRFDYLPRGTHEAWGEQELHAKDGLVLESTIFLHYRVPHYFFVSRNNPQLADRIERGLKLAQKDGSWDKLFNSIPAFRRGQAEINAHKRRVFELERGE
ncbi:transporter substrate-binding domain-containing protein [Massilia sp. erpn]|uniref:transporter substrate-binding domain-containing protein n=1 Tax=Massilia sp. erpn TaxID=2738142 RepID=UPI00210390E2|nr:transporter substrate-binding domain-containing protein [Massilia sp. erpn]UTY56772.1 transporter substrate-binding domain-containing protein [Massilia sp. erpn]